LPKTVFALLHAGGFDLVEQRQQLSLEPEQLRACLAEAPVGVGELSHLGELLGGGGDILRAALAAIGEDGGGVEFSVGAVAGGFAAASAEGVERAGQQGLACQEGLKEFLDLLWDGAELGAEGTEVVRHGLRLRECGVSSVAYNINIPTEVKGWQKKTGRGGKTWNLCSARSVPVAVGRGGARKAARAYGAAERAFSRAGPSARV